MSVFQIAIAVVSAVGGVVLTLVSQLLLLNASARKEYRHTRMVALQNCVSLIDMLFSWKTAPVAKNETPTNDTHGSGDNSHSLELWRIVVKNNSHIGVFIPEELQSMFMRLVRVVLRSPNPQVALDDKELLSENDLLYFRTRCCEIIKCDYGSVVPFWLKRILE